MRNILFVIFLILSFTAIVSAADKDCEVYCITQGYDYGNCRGTTEGKGFCEGKKESVYGFAPCENFDRCCCGPVESANLTSTETIENQTATNVTSTCPSPIQISITPQSVFVLLLIVVGILLLVNLFHRRKKKDKEF